MVNKVALIAVIHVIPCWQPPNHVLNHLCFLQAGFTSCVAVTSSIRTDYWFWEGLNLVLFVVVFNQFIHRKTDQYLVNVLSLALSKPRSYAVPRGGVMLNVNR